MIVPTHGSRTLPVLMVVDAVIVGYLYREQVTVIVHVPMSKLFVDKANSDQGVENSNPEVGEVIVMKDAG